MFFINMIIIVLLYFMFTAIIEIHGQVNDGKNFTLIFKWSVINFGWKNDSQKVNFVKEGKYVAENCMIREFKLSGLEDDLAYITLPRWKSGVPATLVTIRTSAVYYLPTSPVLDPYPSWDMQTVGNCSALQNVHTVEVDSARHRLYVLDNGRTGELGNNRTDCPVKIVVIDLRTNATLNFTNISTDKRIFKKYAFTSMVLDRQRQKLYIPHSNFPHSAILVYDVQSDGLRIFPCEHLDVELQGTTKASASAIFFLPNILVPQFVSIALNTDATKLYFSTFDNTELFYVNTSLFAKHYTASNGDNDGKDLSSNVMNLGQNGRNVKMISDAKGYMYFDDYSERSIIQWREANWVFQYNPFVVIHSRLLHWVSSLYMQERDGYLWIVSTRFRDFISDELNPDKENVRVFRAYVPRKEKPRRIINGFSLEYVVLAMFVLIIGIIIIKIIMFNY